MTCWEPTSLTGKKPEDCDSLGPGVRVLDETIPGCDVSVSRTADGWRAHVTHAPSGMGFRSLQPHATPGLAVLDAAAMLKPRFAIYRDRVRAWRKAPETAP